MADIAALSYKIDASDVDEATSKLRSMDAATLSVNGNAGKLNKSLGITSKNVKTYGTQVQGAGHHTANIAAQFNDIGVMMAAGQSPWLLAAQQGTQLNQVWAQMGEQGKSVRGVVGAIGSSLGAMINPMSILTIGVIAGGAALVQWGISALGASEDADAFQDSMDDLVDVTGSYADALRDSEAPMLSLIEKFGTQAQEASRLFDILARIQRIEFENQLSSSLEQLNGQFDGLRDRLRVIDDIVMRQQAGSDVFLIMKRQVGLLNDEFGIGVDQARGLLDALDSLAGARGPASAALALERVALELVSAKESGADIPPELIRVANEAIQAALEVQALTGALADAAGNAAAIKIDLGMTEGDANALAGLTGDQLLPPPRPSGGGDDYPGRGAGRGANIAARRRERELEAFISSLQTERETLQVWRAEQMELLAQFNESELAAIGGHAEAKLRIEQEYQEGLARLQEGERTRTLDVYSNMFGSMAALAKAGGEKTFGIWKAFSIAQATIDSYRAYTQVLADPFFIGRPWMRAIAAGSVLASGLAQVASIASTSLGGGGGGGGSGAPSSAAGTTQEAAPERVVRLNIEGDGFAREWAEQLAEQLFNATQDGTRVVIAR